MSSQSNDDKFTRFRWNWFKCRRRRRIGLSQVNSVCVKKNCISFKNWNTMCYFYLVLNFKMCLISEKNQRAKTFLFALANKPIDSFAFRYTNHTCDIIVCLTNAIRASTRKSLSDEFVAMVNFSTNLYLLMCQQSAHIILTNKGAFASHSIAT